MRRPWRRSRLCSPFKRTFWLSISLTLFAIAFWRGISCRHATVNATNKRNGLRSFRSLTLSAGDVTTKGNSGVISVRNTSSINAVSLSFLANSSITSSGEEATVELKSDACFARSLGIPTRSEAARIAATPSSFCSKRATFLRQGQSKSKRMEIDLLRDSRRPSTRFTPVGSGRLWTTCFLQPQAAKRALDRFILENEGI